MATRKPFSGLSGMNPVKPQLANAASSTPGSAVPPSAPAPTTVTTGTAYNPLAVLGDKVKLDGQKVVEGNISGDSANAAVTKNNEALVRGSANMRSNTAQQIATNGIAGGAANQIMGGNERDILAQMSDTGLDNAQFVQDTKNKGLEQAQDLSKLGFDQMDRDREFGLDTDRFGLDKDKFDFSKVESDRDYGLDKNADTRDQTRLDEEVTVRKNDEFDTAFDNALEVGDIDGAADAYYQKTGKVLDVQPYKDAKSTSDLLALAETITTGLENGDYDPGTAAAMGVALGSATKKITQILGNGTLTPTEWAEVEGYMNGTIAVDKLSTGAQEAAKAAEIELNKVKDSSDWLGFIQTPEAIALYDSGEAGQKTLGQIASALAKQSGTGTLTEGDKALLVEHGLYDEGKDSSVKDAQSEDDTRSSDIGVSLASGQVTDGWNKWSAMPDEWKAKNPFSSMYLEANSGSLLGADGKLAVLPAEVKAEILNSGAATTTMPNVNYYYDSKGKQSEERRRVEESTKTGLTNIKGKIVMKGGVAYVGTGIYRDSSSQDGSASYDLIDLETGAIKTFYI